MEAPATLEEIRASLDRTAELMAEDRSRMAELRESQRETDRQMKETDRRLKERMQETDRQMRETDRRLKKAEDLFTTQWGRLMESLVEGDLVPLLQERGIAVDECWREGSKRRGGEHYEIDIVAANSADVVVVEVKTTLRPKDVTRFLEKMSRFGEWFPRYRGQRTYGAVAYLQADGSVARQAEKRGLFVIRATGSSASIVNAPDFEPRLFS